MVQADSVGAKNLAKAATSGVGFLPPDATLEQCQELLKRGVDATAAPSVADDTKNSFRLLLTESQVAEEADAARANYSTSYTEMELGVPKTPSAIEELMKRGGTKRPSDAGDNCVLEFFRKEIQMPTGFFAAVSNPTACKANMQAGNREYKDVTLY